MQAIGKCRDCDNPRTNSQLAVCNECFARLNARVAEQSAAERKALTAAMIASHKHRFGNLLAEIPLEALREAIAHLPAPTRHPTQLAAVIEVAGYGALQLTLQSSAARERPARFYWTVWRATRE